MLCVYRERSDPQREVLRELSAGRVGEQELPFVMLVYLLGLRRLGLVQLEANEVFESCACSKVLRSSPPPTSSIARVWMFSIPKW